MDPTLATGAVDTARSIASLRLERDAVGLYEGLAGLERDPGRADAFRAIAADERRHTEVWAERLRSRGVEVPTWKRPRPHIRFILATARVFGTAAVADMVKALEGKDEASYEALGGPEMTSIAMDERRHAEVWRRIANGAPTPVGAELPVTTPGTRQARATAATETWHRSARSGTLRAAVFGVNDGLVSNLALVMGVAGASADQRFVVLAGTAGLLAGAFSMAAGEYVSMQSQRELSERQIALEREELAIMPEVERQELVDLYQARGLPDEQARAIADHLMADPEQALDVMVREELGLDPDELGSPWGAAASSFACFVVGAIIPLVPWLLVSGTAALVSSLTLALVALFLTGAIVSLFTGRGFWFSGFRQAFIGGAAALVTWVVGSLLGVQPA